MRSSKMMMERVKMVAAAAVLVVASGFTAAYAQQGMPGMMQGGGMSMGSQEGMGHEGMMGPGMMMCHMGGHVEGRLAYLKTELKIMHFLDAAAAATASNSRGGDAKPPLPRGRPR